MDSILWSVIGFVVAIGVLVTFHEYGHFWVARRLGVKVLRFSIGFGKPLWRYTSKKGTEYVIAMIPLGGYVKMLDEMEGDVKPADRPFAFNRKPVWIRMLIVLAGPAFNFIFAIAAYWVVFTVGVTVVAPILGHLQPNSIVAKAGLSRGDIITAVNGESVNGWRDVNLALISKLGEKNTVKMTYKDQETKQLESTTLDLTHWTVNQEQPDVLRSLGFSPYFPDIPATIAKVTKDSPAAKAGLKVSDRIIAIAGKPIKNWSQMTPVFDEYINKPVDITVLRGDKTINLPLTPEGVRRKDGLIHAKVGIQSEPVKWPKNLQRTIRYPFFASGLEAVKKTWQLSALTLEILYKMIVGQMSFRSISGPIGIANAAGYSAQMGFNAYLSFLALISISLGIINLLPIPMLDGGHFLYYIIEVIRGKPVSLSAQMFGFRIGLIFIIALMLVAIFNDVSRLFY